MKKKKKRSLLLQQKKLCFELRELMQIHVEGFISFRDYGS